MISKTTYTVFHIPFSTAREWDGETGLYYYRARYYDAGTGRFVSEDNPLLSTLLLLENRNSYPYVNNNPINYIDPNGHIAVSPPINPNYQAQIDSLRRRIAALEKRLQDPCLSAAAKASIRGWIRWLRLLIKFLIQLLSQEPGGGPPGGPPPKRPDIVIVVGGDDNRPKIYGPYW